MILVILKGVHSIDSNTDGAFLSEPGDFNDAWGRRCIWCCSSSFLSLPCLAERHTEQPPEEQKESHALLCDPILGTNTFFWGQQGGPSLLMGSHGLKVSLPGGARGEGLKGRTPSLPQRCPDHLISAPSLSRLLLFSPKGQGRAFLEPTVIFQELRAGCRHSNLIKGRARIQISFPRRKSGLQFSETSECHLQFSTLQFKCQFGGARQPQILKWQPLTSVLLHSWSSQSAAEPRVESAGDV